ncbi:carboxyl-terminal processing protease [Sinobacterium caligoides]|uniref:Carboxyl-terminal processing protease n=1 Tax=Sinobacterium caligoides TaxID=933926 RepID=A0A3N2DY02_9GAMM|nr:carboxy terminal-processing peptidase [Sinobacterium caligoides]ROS04552.1 carboxyl-terminal processing protease [Sinobacterium caligoides]
MKLMKPPFAAACIAAFIASTSSLSVSAKEVNALKPLPVHSNVTEEIVDTLNSRAYQKLDIDDDLSQQLFDNYLKALDPSKSYLLQSDIDRLNLYRDKLDNQLKDGKLEAGYAIFTAYEKRLEERLEKVISELPQTIKSFDFTKDESIAIDDKARKWPATMAEADDLWRKRIKSSVLSLRMDGKDDKGIEELLLKRYQHQLKRITQLETEDVYQLYINSFTQIYDPHTNYLSPRSSENFKINMSLSLEGIGAVLTKEDEYVKIVRLVHSGPAEKTGQLQPADRIIGVGQNSNGKIEDVIGLRLDEVVDKIRGKKGSTVRLEVIPVDAESIDKTKVVTIVRDKVKLEDQSAQKQMLELYDNGKLRKVGVISVPTFYIDFAELRKGNPNYKSTTRDVSKLLAELTADGAEGIIIDLRENGGGSLQEANELTGLFIESGPTVQIRNGNNRIGRQGKMPGKPYYDGPMLVMINRMSASASEIFAGAIQDYRRGVIVGSRSFGKGTVQSLMPLNHGELKITESKFYRISGNSTQHRGVIPDIKFPAIYDVEKVGESTLDDALPWDAIAPARHKFYFEITSIVPELKALHQQRMAEDPDFVYLNDQLAARELINARNTIPLNEKARLQLKEDNEKRMLNIENKKRKAKGLELLASLDDKDKIDAKKEKEKAKEEKPKLDPDTKAFDENDIYLTESGYILVDVINAFNKIAQH